MASWSLQSVAALPYEADDYSYPQSLEARIVSRPRWQGLRSPIPGAASLAPRTRDIEHIVAQSEVHDSGLCAADAETRRRFARDPLNLTLANPLVNRYEKRGKDAAEWLPNVNECWFAARIVEVRRKYGLTIDRRESGALERVLSACPSTEMVIGDCAASEPQARKTTPLRFRRCATSVGRQWEWKDYMRRGAASRHRTRAARPSGIPLYARR